MFLFFSLVIYAEAFIKTAISFFQKQKISFFLLLAIKSQLLILKSMNSEKKFLMFSSNITSTLPLEIKFNIKRIALTPDSTKIIIVDDHGYALLTNLITNRTISHFNFKSQVDDLKFSPDGK